MGEQAWEQERVLSGRPAGRELTQEHTPLEAGLWRLVDLGKGCFIGQETLAKVSKLGALNRELWGLQLTARAEPGAAIVAGGLRATGHRPVGWSACARASMIWLKTLL